MAVSAFKKSTIVRTKFAVLRAGFRATELIAPRYGARLATSLWFKTPPSPAPSPLPPGGFAFEVTAMDGVVRGTYWGDGPVVYLVHGWGGRGDQFAEFVEPLRSTGHRVVMFDALSHGLSGPGPSGAAHAHGVEFGRALDAVAARFGPARAIVSHSMGAVPALLAMRDGWVGADRLVMISPMVELATYFDRFGEQVGFGPRIRRGMDAETKRRTGYPVDEFALARLASDLEPLPPTLVIHDRRDRRTSYEQSAAIVETWPEATLISTDGLGHLRILRAADVVHASVRHVLADVADSDNRADAIA
ncbi:alpha/beta fold hydrolase [Solicola gregarius]|uniref:Alpha/beta hydrolase n=1 Tax=Solicola gregarius TaxID=2908642 RepID=A0AA46YL70_9ACTN|nr:alpha/beta fold hydrolase [Solicola gregarius]UYM04573.1 alpha/beta hydrolase [Solicola gregarius]